jgi:hexosaminidase
MELFPSTYIHIGGDEAPKYRWENCSKCQQRIEEESLEDEHELQSYFIKRIEKFLNKNGRQLIGWDEILEGGLSDNATVQSWRGMEGGVTAASSGHKAIMSPTSHAYFDYDLKSIDLEKVYLFDPIPKELKEESRNLIIGGECNMWTERVPDENNLDSKVFPRLLAMSEVLWSYPQKRDYDEFYDRVQHHYPILKNLQVNYGLETIPARIEVKNGSKGMEIHCIKTNQMFELQYHWACDTCSNINLNKVTGPILLERSGIFSVKAFKKNQEYGSPITQELAFHKGLGSSVVYEQKYSDWYTAGGDQGLTDGKLGSLDFRDGSWQGFYGDDVEAVVDLGKIKKVSSISTHFYQYNNSWIFLPSKVTIEISEDGKEYLPIAETERKREPEERGHFIEEFATSNLNTKGRFIRVKAHSIKKVPSWHEAAGSKAWLFLDEIVIQ